MNPSHCSRVIFWEDLYLGFGFGMGFGIVARSLETRPNPWCIPLKIAEGCIAGSVTGGVGRGEPGSEFRVGLVFFAARFLCIAARCL